jgi:ParB-like chromosome segregation protein Spo0J
MSVALARLKGVVLPAVELAQVREAYYVLDGHHRISVARAFGQESIDAAVTVWEVEE